MPIGGNLPSAIRRQRWFPLNVPLMWAAAGHQESCPLLEWLISATSGMEEPIHFIGGNLSASAAVRAGWTALRQAMRLWGVQSQLELSEWLGNQGFPAARPGSHISARGQEHVLTEGCREDARVALLECVFVAITLEDGRQRPREFPPSAKSAGSRVLKTGSHVEELPTLLARAIPPWAPHHPSGTMPSKVSGDTIGEERAWKAFGLVPAMMLHRPRGVGSIGRDELIERADKFSRGQWLELLGEYRSCTVYHGRGPTRDDNEERRRGQAAGVDRSNFGTQNFEHPCRVARKTSPGATARDSSRSAGEPSKARGFGFAYVHEVFGQCTRWQFFWPGGAHTRCSKFASKTQRRSTCCTVLLKIWQGQNKCIHVCFHDSTPEARRGSARDRNGNCFSQVGGQDTCPPIREGSGSCVCPIPVRPLHASRN